MGGNEGLDEYRNEGIPIQKNSLKSANPSLYDDGLGSEQFATQFSIPSVIYYLQQEWLKQQNEKISFVAEKSELQVKVSRLEGELRASVAQNKFLINRIRMLEEKLLNDGNEDLMVLKENHPVSKNTNQTSYLPEGYPSSSNITEILNSLQNRIKFVNDQISSLSQAFVMQTEISEHFKHFFKLSNLEDSESKLKDKSIASTTEETSKSINSLLSVKEIGSLEVDISSFSNNLENYKMDCDEKKSISYMRMRSAVDVDDRNKGNYLNEFDVNKRVSLTGESLISVSDPPMFGFEKQKTEKKFNPDNTNNSLSKIVSDEDDELIAYRRSTRCRSQGFREHSPIPEYPSKHTILAGHDSTVIGFCFIKSSECTLISVSDNGNICAHVCYKKAMAHQTISCDVMFKENKFLPISCMASTLESIFYIGNNEGRISKWNIEDILLNQNENSSVSNIKPIFFTKYHRNPILSMKKAFSGSKFVCSLRDNTTSIWDCDDDSCMPVNVLAPFFGSEETLVSASFSPEDHSKMVLLTKSKLELYDTEKEIFISHIKYDADITNLCYDTSNSHHSSFFVGQLTGSGKGVLVHGDLRNMSNLSAHDDNRGVSSVICNLPDSNKVISGSCDNNAYLWDIRNWGKSGNFSRFTTSNVSSDGITLLDFDLVNSMLSLGGPGKDIHMFKYADIIS